MTRLLLATGDRFGRIDDPRSSAAIAWSLEGSRAASLADACGRPRRELGAAPLARADGVLALAAVKG